MLQGWGKYQTAEEAKGGGTYYPDEKLNELFEKFRRAFGTALDKGWRQKLDMSQYTENIHLKLPQLFLEAGLTEIRLNGYLSTFLLCDPRRNIEEMQRYVEDRLRLWQRLKKRNKECAVTGGMSKGEFQELFQLYSNYLSNLANNPDKIRQTAEAEILSRVIVHGLKHGDTYQSTDWRM